MSGSVKGAATLATLQGQTVKVDPTHGSVKVGAAHVISADIECSNGVIHAIDAVLLPA